MNTREKVWTSWLTAFAGTIVLILVATTALQTIDAGNAQYAGAHRTTVSSTVETVPQVVSTVLPPGPLNPGNMIGWTLEEIGAQVLKDVQQQGLVESGTPQIRLIRSVKRSDLPDLGLDCLPDFGAIEEPPYVLVILEGNIIPPGTHRFIGGRYISFIYDLWMGGAMRWDYSTSGSMFKVALNDNKLPSPDRIAVSACPTYAGPRVFHYGDVRPTALPLTPSAIKSPDPIEVVPTAVSTYAAPVATPSE